jgi:DNA helicase-2/ATP-dependent DNA helicase PcrA
MDRAVREQLNDRQHEAVTAVEGPVLVIAGAGSGKTRVIEFRVLHLVEMGIDPGSILLLTFTRRSAREMISRAAALDVRCRGVEGGTFHSFANRVLRRYCGFFGLPADFTIYDEADAEEAVQRCAARLGLYARKGRRPRKEMLRKIISMAANKEISIASVLEKHYAPFIEFVDEIKAVREAYTEYKVRCRCLDYDDLLLYMKLLLEDDGVRGQLASRCRYIMIDEFQDTNAVQGQIAYRLAEKHGNVLVVGDDAQSIYAFRGADHENIMRFPELFPGCRIIKLEDNYRSTQAILDLANAVLDNMAGKYEKCLRAAKKERGTKPRLIFLKDAYEEAAWVADRIKELCDEGMELSQQCILFRSAYITLPMQAELTKRNIPFAVYGGLKFYETAHVKDVLAHMKVLVNPRDLLSWSRVLLLVDGVGPRTAEKLLDEIAVLEDLDAMFGRMGEREGCPEGLRRLAAVMGAAAGTTRPGEQCRLIVEYYAPLLRERFDLDWQLRKNDLDALAQIAERYESLRDILVDLAIEPPQRGVRDFHDTVWERPLIMSTIHSAKGLEWRNVFLIGAIDGVLPSSYTTRDAEALQEEQRLLYVAVTRARETLTILVHHEGRNDGIHTFNRLSRFIEPEDVMACLDLTDLSTPFQDSYAQDSYPDEVPDASSQLLAKLLDSMK